MSRVSHRGDERDYHQRFREKFFKDAKNQYWVGQILAFIDGVVAEASLTTSRWAEGREMGHRVGFYDGKEAGRAEERAALIEKAHKILEEHFPKQNQDDPTKPSPNGRGAAMAYMGLLLTHLRGEIPIGSEGIAADTYRETPQPIATQEETEYDGERIVFLKETDEKVHICRAGKSYTFTLPQEEREYIPTLEEIDAAAFSDYASPQKETEPQLVEVIEHYSFGERCRDSHCPCPKLQEETECCEKCGASPNMIPEIREELEKISPPGRACWMDNCPCHKPRTEEKTCQCGEPEAFGSHSKYGQCVMYTPPRTEAPKECKGYASIVDGKTCICGGDMAAVRIEGFSEKLACTRCELSPITSEEKHDCIKRKCLSTTCDGREKKNK